MDATHFDALARSLAAPAPRRTALRLLTGGLFGGLLAKYGSGSAAAAQPAGADSDGDGLSDDVEINTYATDPNNPDTDGDGFTDGEEIANYTDPLDAAPPAVTPPPCAQLGSACTSDDNCCVGYCGQDAICRCIPDSERCYPSGYGGCCNGQPCNAQGYCGSTCGDIGAGCNSDGECCQQGNFPVLCCFSGVSLTTVCTDVSATGNVCPGDAPVAAGCLAGQTDCGGTCVDLSSHAGHCGACFDACPLGGICQGGVCGGTICMDGLTDCGGSCVDLASDEFHCGACYTSCPLGGYCSGGVCGGLICGEGLADCYGRCVDLSSDWSSCGACDTGCFEGATCVGGQCV